MLAVFVRFKQGFSVQETGDWGSKVDLVGVAGVGEEEYDSGFLKSGKLANCGLLGWKIL